MQFREFLKVSLKRFFTRVHRPIGLNSYRYSWKLAVGFSAWHPDLRWATIPYPYRYLKTVIKCDIVVGVMIN